MSDKRSWPELVGVTGEEAKDAILNERPGLLILIVKDGASVTFDYCESRVRIFVDDNGIVTKAPCTG